MVKTELCFLCNMRRKLKIDSIFFYFNLFTVYLVIFIMRCIGSPIHKCYVCGPESEQPFVDEKFMNTSREIINNCQTFDQSSDIGKETFAIECPKGYGGCITKIANQVTRTCSNVNINDCQTVNGDYICICNNYLCNGKNTKNSNLHIYNEEDTEKESDENDQESGDDDNYEPFIHTSTRETIQHTIFASDTNITDYDDVTTKLNEFVKTSVSTMQPSINTAVNFNLSVFQLFINCVIFFAISYLNSYTYVNRI